MTREEQSHNPCLCHGCTKARLHPMERDSIYSGQELHLKILMLENKLAFAIEGLERVLTQLKRRDDASLPE